MMKGADSPFWQRPQFDTLTSSTWDIVVVMLGTNDARDLGSGGADNWHHNCGGPTAPTLDGCTYATDYAAMINVIRNNTNAATKIYAMTPPPLMQAKAVGANQTVINSVLPQLIPMISKANKVSLIDVFAGMGGVPDWQKKFPFQCNPVSGLVHHSHHGTNLDYSISFNRIIGTSGLHATIGATSRVAMRPIQMITVIITWRQLCKQALDYEQIPPPPPFYVSE